MATGLMTLAYMAEMAIVFNVAYFELSRGRYIAEPEGEAQSLSKLITSTDPGANEAQKWVIGSTKITDRLEDMFSAEAGRRQQSWYTQGPNKSTPHKDLWAGEVFEFFRLGRDKEMCQHALVLSALALSAITLVDRLGEGSDIQMRGHALLAGLLFGVTVVAWFVRFVYSSIRVWIPLGLLGLAGVAACADAANAGFATPWSCSVWWFFFALFAGTLAAPSACVAIGRRMRVHLRDCISHARSQFEDLKSAPLEKIGP